MTPLDFSKRSHQEKFIEREKTIHNMSLKLPAIVAVVAVLAYLVTTIINSVR